MIGLKLSGPGDFFELKPLRARLTFFNETVSLCMFQSNSDLTFLALSNLVGFRSVWSGKWVSYKCFIVSSPGCVSVRSFFLHTPIGISGVLNDLYILLTEDICSRLAKKTFSEFFLAYLHFLLYSL